MVNPIILSFFSPLILFWLHPREIVSLVSWDCAWESVTQCQCLYQYYLYYICSLKLYTSVVYPTLAISYDGSSESLFLQTDAKQHALRWLMNCTAWMLKIQMNRKNVLKYTNNLFLFWIKSWTELTVKFKMYHSLLEYGICMTILISQLL